MPRVVNDVENARQMEERTNAQQVAPSVREKSVRIADESEVENRLGSARSMLRKLSKEMCDCVTISDGSTRLFRQFEAFWEDKIVALTQSIAEYSPEIQRKIRLVAAERDKISKEMEDAIEANELEEQLTLLQRCTRQLEAIRISENPDKVLQEKLCGRIDNIVSEIKEARMGCKKASSATDSLIGHAEACRDSASTSLSQASTDAAADRPSKSVSVSIAVTMD